MDLEPRCRWAQPAMVASGKETTRLAVWDQAEELVALDRLRFQHLHRVIYAHRQRVENAESYYDSLETERQAQVMHHRAEAMRIARAKRKEQAVGSLKRDNQRMVQRLCVVPHLTKFIAERSEKLDPRTAFAMFACFLKADGP